MTFGPANGEGGDLDLSQIVNVSSGDAPHRPHHVRDEQALIDALPPCELPSVSQAIATRVELATYRSAQWIPVLDATEVMEVPEPAWQHWEWGPWESLLVHVYRDPHLPLLGNLSVREPRDCKLMVAGRAMRVRRYAPGDSGWAGEGFTGAVSGFLDESTSFWAQSVAPSESRRDALLGVVGTLTRF